MWAHDTAICMEGMAQEGYIPEAKEIAKRLLKAAVAFDYHIPELYSGDRSYGTAVPYPAACHPQAWSAAAAVAVWKILSL